MDRSRIDRCFATATFLLAVGLIGMIHGWGGATYVGSGLLGMFVAKLSISYRARAQGRGRWRTLPPPLRVCIVMPVHNEDPAFAAAAVASMLAQTRRPDRIHVIDDGSTDGGAAADAVEVVLAASHGVAWHVTRLTDNVGKRDALAVGFRAASDAQVFVCVDSDTVLNHDALAEGLRPFADPRVAAVAGFVTAWNWRRNLLTRLIDLRYVSAFLAERAAYSYFGAVLCCCGSLSLYRAEVIRANLDDFVAQRFLGQHATFGDDRRLTNYALRAGRVVLQETSIAHTIVPEHLGHYLRQQIRWNKSFIRESAWVLGTFPLTHAAFWLTLAEVMSWTVIGTLLFASLLLAPFILDLDRFTLVATVIALAAYARNTAYLSATPRTGIRPHEQLLVFVLAPLYAALHIGLLVPLRLWSLLTLRHTRWGTRTTIEVHADTTARQSPRTPRP